MGYTGKALFLGFLSSLLGLGGCGESESTSLQQNVSQIQVAAQLNHLLMPIDRGERYEDPLDEALRQRGLGETVGGGTMLSQSGEIEFIDVEIVLDNEEEGIPFVIQTLEELGAPRGSLLRVYDADPPREIPFGRVEGIAVYLDGVNLPDEVYATSDVNVVIEEIQKRLRGYGEIQGYWQGPRETALYLYGKEAEEMRRLISDFLDTYPLCKGARVVTIAPKTETQTAGGDSIETAPQE